MRRKPGALLPLELAILEVAAARAEPVHGFELAKALADASGARALTAHGTLYKALARLAEAGLLAPDWEDAAVALAAGRPRRRLYRLTAEGAARLAVAREATAAAAGAAPPPPRPTPRPAAGHA